MKTLLCLLTVPVITALPSARAASIVELHEFNGLNLGVPDGNPSGTVNVQGVTSNINVIEDISVSLNISGTWSGDLYAYLQHDSGLAVVLNRVGRTVGESFGYDNDGMTITLNDLGTFSDIHSQDSGGGVLSGTFGSDGRTTDPGSVLDTDPRGALLTTFIGGDANGDWVLFVADLSGGDSHTLNSWSMEITGVNVPEPGTLSLFVFGAALLMRRKR